MGKVPPHADWQTTPYKKFPAASLAAPGTGAENYGIVLHDTDLVIDIDPRNFSPATDKPYSRLLKDIGIPPISSFTVQTGSGGFHIYLRKPADIAVVYKLDKYPGIEFKSCGGQVVGPGSFHHLAQGYYTVRAGSPAAVADAPAQLLEILATAKRERKSTTPERLVDDLQTRTRFADYLREAPPSIEGAQGDKNAFAVAAHGRDLGLPPSRTLELMLEFWNHRCSPPWEAGELELKVQNAYKYGKGSVGEDHPAADFSLPVPPTPTDPVALNPKPDVFWVYGKGGTVVKCFRNLLNYFYEPTAGLRGVFAYNEFSVRCEFVQPAPWHRGRLPLYRGVTDHDLHMLKGFLASRHRYESSIPEIESAIANAADTQRFHPVREYLKSLSWDGMKRLDSWLATYLGAVDEGAPAYLAAAGRKTLCAAVMRILQPGISFDHVLVLEGAQDIGKSSVVRILGGEWASDSPVDPHSRDTVDALQGRWIVEMAELEQFRKADEDAMKAFITRPTDRVRLAYGRTTGEYARQCIFIGSKNPRADMTYLKDDTGNRRWWPVYCNPPIRRETGLAQFDFDGLRAVRDQLFAEAVHLMTNENCRPREPLSMHTPELKRQAAAVVSRRLAKHDWTETVAEWIARQQSNPETRMKFVTSIQVFKHALSGNDKEFDRRTALGIAGIMRDLGWEPSFGRQMGVLHRGWRKGEAGAEKAPETAAPMPAKSWSSLL